MTLLLLDASLMGMGVFVSHAPQSLLRIVGGLIGHLVYGGTLGLVAERAEKVERTNSVAWKVSVRKILSSR